MIGYPILVDSKQHLFDLNILQSFKRFPEVYFQVHLMQDDLVQIFWRTALSREEFYQVGSKAAKLCSEVQSLQKLSQTPEYYNEMEKINPLQSVMMDERDSQIILRLFHDGLPKQYKDICGFDGHEFMLTIYGNHPQSLQFWCYVRPELTLAAEVINNIVQKANLDPKFYGVQISNDAD